MPSNECRSCGIFYPLKAVYHTCENCGQATYYNPSRAPTYVEDIAPEPGEFPLLNAPLEIRDGSLIIDSHKLIRRGHLSRLEPGGIYRVEIDGNTFHIEILDYSYTGRLYLVREFQLTAPDYVPEEWLPKKKRRKKK